MSAQVLPFQLSALEALEFAAQVPFAEQVPSGRLSEIARIPGGAQLTLAVACLAGAQARGEPVAWVQQLGGSLFPPDLAESGVDLEALVVVHVPRPAGSVGLCKAAELLLRSGGFGMVVIDLVDGSRTGWRRGPPLPGSADLSLQAQSRLLALAREYDTAVLLLSDGPRQGSLGPLVGLCIEPHRVRVGRGAFHIEPRARKDKSGSLRTIAADSRRGPLGLR
jgi:recombination protein RecA